jgi:hypothetical protein
LKLVRVAEMLDDASQEADGNQLYYAQTSLFSCPRKSMNADKNGIFSENHTV